MFSIKRLFVWSLALSTYCSYAQTTVINATTLGGAKPVTTLDVSKWAGSAIVELQNVTTGEEDQYQLIDNNGNKYDRITTQPGVKFTLVPAGNVKIKKPEFINDPKSYTVLIKKQGTDVGSIKIDFPAGTKKPVLNNQFENLTAYVKSKIAAQPKFEYIKKKNLLLEDNIIHVFVDEKGNFLYGGIPTTATQENTFQFHVVTFETDATFRISVEGVFKPSFQIDDTSKDIAVPNSTGDPEVKTVNEWDFGIEGPFTGEASIKIFKVSDAEPIVDRKITIAKLYHVSISTGFLATTLRNPTSIQKMAVPNGAPGDSTLVADDPAARGLVSIMAVYYPKGRSFLFPPSGDIFSAERIGILVGAQLNDKLQENFLAGLSFDFARGGSVAFGAHFGRRNYVAGYEKFKFKEDLITGDLIVKKEWQLGFFFGVVVDTRVALKLFNLGDPK